MCIGVEILSENRLRRRSCVTKVRLTALYMYLDFCHQLLSQTGNKVLYTELNSHYNIMQVKLC